MAGSFLPVAFNSLDRPRFIINMLWPASPQRPLETVICGEWATQLRDRKRRQAPGPFRFFLTLRKKTRSDRTPKRTAAMEITRTPCPFSCVRAAAGILYLFPPSIPYFRLGLITPVGHLLKALRRIRLCFCHLILRGRKRITPVTI